MPKGTLSEFKTALEEEIDKIRKVGLSSVSLTAGRRLESHGNDFWYLFHVEYLPALPADTPCKLLIGQDSFDVTVISLEENAITLSSYILLPEALGKARLENGATVLMERLIQCIEENANKKDVLGNRMLAPNGLVYPARKNFFYDDLSLSEKNTESQNRAILTALTYDITYIWGPPGTGKTTEIGQIANELFKHGRSVLVVSHTNTAVDGAIEKVDKIYSNTHCPDDLNYPILRIGVPSKPLPEAVLLKTHIAKLGKDLYAKKEALEKQQAQIQKRTNEIAPFLAKDTWIKENRLSAIEAFLDQLSFADSSIKSIQEEIARLTVSLEKEKSVDCKMKLDT